MDGADISRQALDAGIVDELTIIETRLSSRLRG
jgi:hypothetical protein